MREGNGEINGAARFSTKPYLINGGRVKAKQFCVDAWIPQWWYLLRGVNGLWEDSAGINGKSMDGTDRRPCLCKPCLINVEKLLCCYRPTPKAIKFLPMSVCLLPKRLINHWMNWTKLTRIQLGQFTTEWLQKGSGWYAVPQIILGL